MIVLYMLSVRMVKLLFNELLKKEYLLCSSVKQKMHFCKSAKHFCQELGMVALYVN